MIQDRRIGVIIPALNEEQSIASVIRDIPGDVDEIIVVDNGSSDETKASAGSAGATVLSEPRRGYGYACLKGIEYLTAKDPDIIVFLDGDYSDYPEELLSLVVPIIDGQYDLVIGSRMIGQRQAGAMLPQALFGNWLATRLIRLFWSYRFTDLGPFRAIRASALHQLNMSDGTYGWTVEMQIKAAKKKLRCTELPVRYRKRVGKSKVTGTVGGTVKASVKILYTIFRYALSA
ncbi:MAG TPA: glycosyltransferase family 2 protein [Candidatus Kapabacteria bacterium]|nr:glycosyltransferase family 2 protein [Candidatus Kapabacteria bacterium]